MQCKAHNRAGKQCGKPSIIGGTVCRNHGGGAPQVKRSAKLRILEAADPVAAELVRLALNSENDSVRRQACSDLLDRAGLKPTDKMELTGADGGPLDQSITVTFVRTNQ